MAFRSNLHQSLQVSRRTDHTPPALPLLVRSISLLSTSAHHEPFPRSIHLVALLDRVQLSIA